jgi:hypothetical protein
MALRGDDPWYDFSPAQKDALEPKLRAEARSLFRDGKRREATAKLRRAKEISRRKSKRAHQGAD